MILYRFHEVKATQAAAYLIRKHGDHMSLIRLLKLLYLADRKAVVARGNPITGDTAYSMRYGPVLSEIYNRLKSESADVDTYWSRHIERVPWHDVRVTGNPGDDELSEQEIEWLDETTEEHRNLDTWSISELTHQLPEWHNPGESSIQIRIEDILEHAGYSPEEIAELESEIASEYAMDEALTRSG